MSSSQAEIYMNKTQNSELIGMDICTVSHDHLLLRTVWHFTGDDEFPVMPHFCA